MALFGRRQWALGLPEKTAAGRSLTASGTKIDRKQADSMRRLIQPWQSRAFAYYDILGEIKYAAQFYSRALSNLRLFVGQIDDQGEVEEVDNDPNLQEFLERIRDPGGGRSNLLAAYGRLMFLAGECYLFVSKNPDTDEEQWEMLSTDELRVTAGGYIRYTAPSMEAQNFAVADDDAYEPVDDKTAVGYRLWKRHPRYSLLADSTMQGVLDLCEELVLLTQAVRARARSRLAGSGILFLSEDFGPGPVEVAPDEDPAEDPFLEVLTEAMTLPMVEEGTASAVVPLLVRGSTEAIQNGVRHLQIIDPVQLYPETGLRRECIERIAMGLDLPPEILLGMTDANHWTAWMVDEQTWKAHLQPVAQQLCDDLTSAYLRPALKQAGINNWEDYTVGYDAAAIINHPDRTKDAKDLYDRRAIGKTTLRDTAGFQDEDAPTDDELNEMLGVALRDASLAVDGIPTVRGGVIEPQPGELVSKSPTGGETGAQPKADQTPGAVEPGPPTNGKPTQPQDVVNTTLGSMNGELLTAKILGAADLACHRAREAAGNRLRSYANRDPDILKLIDGVKPSQIAPTLGPEKVRQLKAPNEKQLAEGAGHLLAETLPLWGINPDIAQLLGERIEQHVARTLYQTHPGPLPQSFTSYIKTISTTSSK